MGFLLFLAVGDRGPRIGHNVPPATKKIFTRNGISIRLAALEQ